MGPDSPDPELFTTPLLRAERTATDLTTEACGPAGERLSALARSLPGQVLAERFRITRFIASGGMGEVYEAEDLQLQERVALKTIRPELVEDERMLARFKREIQLARKVTHPNVARIYEFHLRVPIQSGNGNAAVLTFLTMELLPGKNLAELLRNAGGKMVPLRTSEALPIIRQMAAGIAAAHLAGVIHRDLKPGNVILVPSTHDENGTRVVVTDFGLARGADSDLMASLTASDAMVGTAPYMAPEQVIGETITVATDVYAFGVMLYEMVTGVWPFTGDNAMVIATRRLHEKPPSPRQHVAALPANWEYAILRCLERTPADRFGSIGDVVRALEGERVADSRPLRKRARRRRLALLTAGPLLGLLLGGVALVKLYPGAYERGVRHLLPAPQRRAVAVLSFKDVTGNGEKWYSSAIAQTVTTELAAGDQLRTVSGEEVDQTRRDLNLPDGESLGRDTLHRVHQRLDANLVVIGSYILEDKQSGQLRLDLRLQDTEAGQTVASAWASGSKLTDVARRAADNLRQQMGIAPVAEAEEVRTMATLPSNAEATRLFFEGLQKLRNFDPTAAAGLLQQASAKDPEHALTHSSLAEALSMLGYDKRAREASQKAVQLAGDLPHIENLLITGRNYELNNDWNKAVETYQALWTWHPDELEYGLLVAGAKTHGGRARDALDTLKALRKQPGPAGKDPRIDLLEAEAASVLGDYQTQQAAAERALAGAKSLNERLLAARALLWDCRGLDHLGKPDEALPRCQESQKAAAELGDRLGEARAINGIAQLLAGKGDYSGAKKAYAQALDALQQIGNKLDAAGALNNLATILHTQGDSAAARKNYEAALALFQEIGNQSEAANTLLNLAGLLHDDGDLPGARNTGQQALMAAKMSGNEDAVAQSLTLLGMCFFEAGDLEGASARLQEAKSINEKLGHQSALAVTLDNIGDVLLQQGRLDEARKAYERALALQQGPLGEVGNAAATRASLAYLGLQEGHPDRAEAGAAQAAAELNKEKDLSGETAARIVLGNALLAQKKSDAAREQAMQALALSKRAGDRALQLASALLAARVEAARGGTAEATRQLNGVLAQSMKFNLVEYTLEARLALAELAIGSGKISEGKRQLQQVQDEAKMRGFVLIARKAAGA
jgi:tetratricopeptide (TPR) repeat protein/tRNA A-37 threonylcarbamoyl transferase component Bud32